MTSLTSSPQIRTWLRQASEPPPFSLILYTPVSNLIAYEWESAADILNHLAYYPADRDQLRAEAHRRSPNHPTLFYIYHPLLQRSLHIISNESDGTFLKSIKHLLWKLEFPQRMKTLQDALTSIRSPFNDQPLPQILHYPCTTLSFNPLHPSLPFAPSLSFHHHMTGC